MCDNMGGKVNCSNRVAVYCRLSNEDEASIMGESNSIVNQKELLLRYVNERGWTIKGVYVDDGFSGLNFERPGFKKMLEDIKLGIVNVVITKDMSRLGRDYIDVGYYIEKFFPENNVRYIALNDAIDSENENGNNDVAPFRAVLNDMYSRDISKKVKSIFGVKRREGKFIGAFAAYGYTKDEMDKNKLCIDLKAKEVVITIFDMYLKGHSITAIARYLNSMGIDSPTMYNIKKYGTYKNTRVKKFLWSYSTIKAILTNPVYTGSIAQNKFKRLNYKSKKLIAVGMDKWVIVKGTHEAIIDQKKFNIIQENINGGYRNNKDKVTRGTNFFSGIAFCGNCGCPMTYTKVSNTKKYLICSTYKKYGKESCKRHSISEVTLLGYIKKALKDDIITCADKIKIKSEISEYIKKKREFIPKNNIDERNIKDRIGSISIIVESLYSDLVKGVMALEKFYELKKRFEEEKEVLQAKLKKQESIQKLIVNNKREEKILEDIINMNKLSKIIICRLIRKVIIYENGDIKIFFRFREPHLNSRIP